MGAPEVTYEGLAFAESPRWHDGRIWVADWAAQEIVAIDARTGASEVVVDSRGHAYVNSPEFDMMAGEEFAPGSVALVPAEGEPRLVADGLAFPNGMAVTPDNSTLIVAESYANRLSAFDIEADGGLSGRRVWAEAGDDDPDGICTDADGAVWYADVGNRRCVRAREGGEVLDSIELDRGCFACVLGGDDSRTLFMVGQEWAGAEGVSSGKRTGLVWAAPAPAAAAGWP